MTTHSNVRKTKNQRKKNRIITKRLIKIKERVTGLTLDDILHTGKMTETEGKTIEINIEINQRKKIIKKNKSRKNLRNLLKKKLMSI